MDVIRELENKVNSKEDVTFEEAIELSKINDAKNLQELFKAADRIRERFSGEVVDLCSIMNAKSGRCSEDCKFCAQSAHYKTDVEEYDLVTEEAALMMAKENEVCGVNRFSLVTSGRGVNDKEFNKVISIYERLRNEVKINLCASLGIIDYEQLKELKKAGITMYHHNLETSEAYYEKICTTHSYKERIDTINNAKEAGLMVCSGGIIGMGESMEDRINLALTLRELNVTSIPVNVLNPIKGTPLEDAKSLSQEEILKTIAIFRFINPTAFIRLAGGRNLIDDYGKACFKVGANATISGNYLTTSGNKIKDDIEMIRSLDLKVVDINLV